MLKYVEDIAKVVHENNRIYANSIGEDFKDPWETAPQHLKDSIIDGILKFKDNPEMTPEENHKNWMAFKLADGWALGEKIDFEAKTHPCLVDYADLPKEQQVKNSLWLNTVKGMLNQYTFEEFQQDALRTAATDVDKINIDSKFLHMAMNYFLVGAEMLDIIKKNVFYGKVPTEKQFDNIRGALYDCPMPSSLMYDKPDQTLEINVDTFHGIIGMATEAGELIQQMLENVVMGFDGIDKINVMEECADSDWYKALLFKSLDVTEEDSRRKVIAKLKARYPAKFTKDCAINRDLNVERKVLETA